MAGKALINYKRLPIFSTFCIMPALVPRILRVLECSK